MAGVSKMYTSRLAVKDRENYFKKLSLPDGKQLTDPYEITEWEEDVTKWPDVQWPDIHLFLVEKVYTREKLRAYKSLDAYKYVMRGHVQSIQYHDFDSEFCVLRSKVLPSQRQGRKTETYDAWAIVNRKESYILTAHCTCMAGLDSCCSHAAAILFKVELCVRMGRTEKPVVTEEACSWKPPSRREVKPSPLRDICFQNTKKLDRLRKASKCVRDRVSPKVLTDDDILELKLIAPNAAVLTSFMDSDTDTASEDSDGEVQPGMPEPMPASVSAIRQ